MNKIYSTISKKNPSIWPKISKGIQEVSKCPKQSTGLQGASKNMSKNIHISYYTGAREFMTTRPEGQVAYKHGNILSAWVITNSFSVARVVLHCG